MLHFWASLYNAIYEHPFDINLSISMPDSPRTPSSHFAIEPPTLRVTHSNNSAKQRMNLGSWLQTHHKGKGTYCQQEKSCIIRGLVGGKWHELHTRYQGPHSASPPRQFKGSHISSLRVPHVPSPDLCTCCFLSLDWPPLQMPSRLYLPCQTPLCTQELCIATASSLLPGSLPWFPSPISLALPTPGWKPPSHYITVTCRSSVTPFGECGL